MPNFNVTITPQRTVNVRVAINQGAPGPNRITEQTATPISGVLVGDGGVVRPAEDGEVVSQADIQSAIDEALAEIVFTVIDGNGFESDEYDVLDGNAGL